VLVAAIALVGTASAQAASWEAEPPMPTERLSLAATAGIDGRIYAIGGGNATANFLDTVEVYTPATKTWATAAPLPVRRDRLAAATGADGRIYALGGVGPGAFTGSSAVSAYGPSTDTWTSVAPMSEARDTPTAAAGADGRIYAIGGLDASSATKRTVEAYTPSTNTWTPVASMPTARYGAAAVTGADGRIYVFGGCDNNGNLFGAVEAYTPATNTWSTLSPMPTPRCFMGAATGGGERIWVYGGVCCENRQATDLVELYDPRQDVWTNGPPMLNTRSEFGAAQSEERIYAIGGGIPGTGPSDLVESLGVPSPYPRPKGATPLLASLVIAYEPCTSPNRQHGGPQPLDAGSCNPPAQASSFLTVGTLDANGAPENAQGLVRYDVVKNAPPAPNDVLIKVSETDVRCKSPGITSCGSANAAAGPDYAGQLRATVSLRITDRLNGPNEDGPATVQDTPFPVPVPCSATPDTMIGSSCPISTSANAVLAGTVRASGNRAIWELGPVLVYDGGSDGDAGTTGGDTLFMNEGIFVP
jgi:N-acetylneuraminic acid mutarotase